MTMVEPPAQAAEIKSNMINTNIHIPHLPPRLSRHNQVVGIFYELLYFDRRRDDKRKRRKKKIYRNDERQQVETFLS